MSSSLGPPDVKEKFLILRDLKPGQALGNR